MVQCINLTLVVLNQTCIQKVPNNHSLFDGTQTSLDPLKLGA
jgi:hypothetical protein